MAHLHVAAQCADANSELLGARFALLGHDPSRILSACDVARKLGHLEHTPSNPVLVEALLQVMSQFGISAPLSIGRPKIPRPEFSSRRRSSSSR
jgi:hypothetical protein